MRKTILVITLLSLLLPLGTGVLAKKGLPSPGITPDSIFYFIDTIGEKIGLFFAFGAEKKIAKALKYADEKLAEAIEMAEEKETEALKKANKKYQEYLDLANQEAKKLEKKDAEELLDLIIEKTIEHQEALSEVLEEVSEKTKEEIEEAIEAAKEGFEKAFEELPEEEQEEWGEAIEGLENKEIERVVSAFFEYIIKKEYDKALVHVITTDGGSLSEKDKQDFIKEIEKKPVVDFSISKITDYELDEMGKDLTAAGFTKFKIVEFTIIFEAGIEEIKGGFGVGYISGGWKILLDQQYQ